MRVQGEVLGLGTSAIAGQIGNQKVRASEALIFEYFLKTEAGFAQPVNEQDRWPCGDEIVVADEDRNAIDFQVGLIHVDNFFAIRQPLVNSVTTRSHSSSTGPAPACRKALTSAR